MTGLVHIYCGDGKGKTTAACGLALRCAYYGNKIVLAQFLKSGESGEAEMLRRLPNIKYFGGKPTGKFSFQMNEAETYSMSQVAQMIFAQACEAAHGAQMLILDEIMAALSCGFFTVQEVVDFVKKRPEGLEVVLTGRNPPPELIELADYISEINNVKHPYYQGIAAREGIER